MKYYLIKRLDRENSFEENKYAPITEVTDWTRSKEIMLYDEINNNCWYCFIYEPDAKLRKIKKEDIKKQLSFVSDDPTLESFHEVDKEIFLDTIKNMIEYRKGNDKEILKDILSKIENIIDKSNELNMDIDR